MAKDPQYGYCNMCLNKTIFRKVDLRHSGNIGIDLCAKCEAEVVGFVKSKAKESAISKLAKFMP